MESLSFIPIGLHISLSFLFLEIHTLHLYNNTIKYYLHVDSDRASVLHTYIDTFLLLNFASSVLIILSHTKFNFLFIENVRQTYRTFLFMHDLVVLRLFYECVPFTIRKKQQRLLRHRILHITTRTRNRREKKQK